MKDDVDYYKVLGLRKGATPQEVKTRFRQLAFRFHPDRNPGDPVCEESFKLVADAYHVLSDRHRRQLYDYKGHQGLKEHGYRGFQETEDVLKTFASELFEFLGISGAQAPRGPLRGADLCYEIELSSEEAALGVQKEIRIEAMEICSPCLGNGFVPTSGLEVCPWCTGTGAYRGTSGVFMAYGSCPKCNGEGRMRQRSCTSCDGHGRLHAQKSVLLNIPPGVENNSRIKISSEGDGGEHSAQSGDLYVLLHVRPFS